MLMIMLKPTSLRISSLCVPVTTREFTAQWNVCMLVLRLLRTLNRARAGATEKAEDEEGHK